MYRACVGAYDQVEIRVGVKIPRRQEPGVARGQIYCSLEGYGIGIPIQDKPLRPSIRRESRFVSVRLVALHDDALRLIRFIPNADDTYNSEYSNSDPRGGTICNRDRDQFVRPRQPNDAPQSPNTRSAFV